MDGTCNNCGSPCDDPKYSCCGGCTTIPYRTTTTTTTTRAPPPPERPKFCFPSNAKVNLENGKSVTMSELKIGDLVQTGICEYLNIFTVKKHYGGGAVKENKIEK